MINTYDEHNPSKAIRTELHQLALLPPKLRLKRSEIYNIVGQFFTTIQSLIKLSPDFHRLSLEARRTLTKHNLDSVGALNGIFLCRELNLYRDEIFFDSCNLYYGPNHMMNCVRTSDKCDSNGSLIKILLFIMICSSNCSIATFDTDETMKTMEQTRDLIRFQDIYANILWKYLVYLYGYDHAVLRMASLVKNMLDVMLMLDMMPTNEKHQHMVDAIVMETEKNLLIEDEKSPRCTAFQETM